MFAWRRKLSLFRPSPEVALDEARFRRWVQKNGTDYIPT